MKKLRILSWTVNADDPDHTHVVAAVLTELGSIAKTDTYELSLPGRYETLTPAFEGAVKDQLRTAGVLVDE